MGVGSPGIFRPQRPADSQNEAAAATFLPLHKNTTGPLKDGRVRRGPWRHLRPTLTHIGPVVVSVFPPRRADGRVLCTPEAGSLVKGSVCEAHQCRVMKARVVLTAAGQKKL